MKLALWVDRLIVNKAIGMSPLELVCGTQVRLPVNNLLPVYKFLQNEDMELSEPMENGMIQIVEVEELRTLAHKRN